MSLVRSKWSSGIVASGHALRMHAILAKKSSEKPARKRRRCPELQKQQIGVEIASLLAVVPACSRKKVKCKRPWSTRRPPHPIGSHLRQLFLWWLLSTTKYCMPKQLRSTLRPVCATAHSYCTCCHHQTGTWQPKMAMEKVIQCLFDPASADICEWEAIVLLQTVRMLKSSTNPKPKLKWLLAVSCSAGVPCHCCERRMQRRLGFGWR